MKNETPAFWDASAVVPLCVPEFSSAQLYRTISSFRPMVVWWATPVEVLSVVARLVELRRSWVEIVLSGAVRHLAEPLPQKCRLRADDALQLAAALVWCSEYPRNRPFVCFDHRLAKAAAEIGFTVIGETG